MAAVWKLKQLFCGHRCRPSWLLDVFRMKSDMTHSDRKTMRNFKSRGLVTWAKATYAQTTVLFCIFDINLHFLCYTHAFTYASVMAMSRASNNKTSFALMRRVIKKVHKLKPLPLHYVCAYTRIRMKLLWEFLVEKKVSHNHKLCCVELWQWISAAYFVITNDDDNFAS